MNENYPSDVKLDENPDGTVSFATDVIATIADATGDEYKDGTHLHFEVLSNGKAIDPTTYLTLAEKCLTMI